MVCDNIYLPKKSFAILDSNKTFFFKQKHDILVPFVYYNSSSNKLDIDVIKIPTFDEIGYIMLNEGYLNISIEDSEIMEIINQKNKFFELCGEEIYRFKNRKIEKTYTIPITHRLLGVEWIGLAFSGFKTPHNSLRLKHFKDQDGMEEFYHILKNIIKEFNNNKILILNTSSFPSFIKEEINKYRLNEMIKKGWIIYSYEYYEVYDDYGNYVTSYYRTYKFNGEKFDLIKKVNIPSKHINIFLHIKHHLKILDENLFPINLFEIILDYQRQRGNLTEYLVGQIEKAIRNSFNFKYKLIEKIIESL